MSETNPQPNPVDSNPHRWVTPQVFYQFAHDLKINYHCQKCATIPKLHYCDTGHEDGYLPRSSAYTSTDQGFVNMAQSRHIPCVRVTCVHCGNIDLYSMYALENWNLVRSRAQQTPALGGLFGLGENDGRN